jgi:hypothetical protein
LDARAEPRIKSADVHDETEAQRLFLGLALVARRSQWPSIICLEGNHEQLMRNALRSDGDFLVWLDFGGGATLSSYGVSPAVASSDPETTR